VALAEEDHSSPALVAAAVVVAAAVLAEDTHQHPASLAVAHLVLPTAILDSAQGDIDTAAERLAVALPLAAISACLSNPEMD